MPVTAADTADAVKETLTDRAKLQELMAGGGETFAEWVEQSIQARLGRDAEITDQVKEQTEKFMIDFLRQNEGKEVDAIAHRLNLDNPNARARIKPNTVYNKKAMGVPHDGMFPTVTDFLYSISDHAHKDADLTAKLGKLQNSLSSVKPSDGGFLIPEILRAEMLRTSLEMAIVRSRARVIPMDSLSVAFPTVDSTSNVSSVFGGIIGYWTEEGATLTASQPRFGRVELRAQKLALYTEIPNELLYDAQQSLEAFISEVFPEALAWYEDVAFFAGGGVGEPLGFLNAPAAINVTRSTVVAGNNVEWVDCVNMYSQMLPQSLDRAVWLVSPDVMPSLLTQTIPGGTPLVIGGQMFASGAEGVRMSILGRPIIVTEKARAVGTSGDINFVDFGFYLIGDRQAMSARQSEEFRFNQDVTAFRVIERLDGRPWLANPITPQNNGNQLSPFIKLT